MLEKFTEDIIVIDEREYGRDDLGKIMAAFAGHTEKSDCDPKTKAFVVYGKHNILGIDVSSFVVEYNVYTGLITDYILYPAVPRGPVLASVAHLAKGEPDIYEDTFTTMADYPMGGNRQITIALTGGKGYYVLLMWM